MKDVHFESCSCSFFGSTCRKKITKKVTVYFKNGRGAVYAANAQEVAKLKK